jgi:benzodiazapine receptor
MNRDMIRQALVVVATLAVITVNVLANALPLNGQNTGEISDRFDILFVPAGYVFSIWSLIYLGLIAYSIFQASPGQRENPRLRRIGYLYVLSSIANIVWLFLWHYEVFTLTLVAMVTILLSLILIYLRLDVGRSRVSRGERWSVHVPFSIYLGWITVATIANTSQVLFFINGNDWWLPPEAWTLILLAVGIGLATAASWNRRDFAYSLVLVWAYIGIGVEQADNQLVSISAYVAAALILATLGASLVRTPRRPAPA